jgi:hypothetical protein
MNSIWRLASLAKQCYNFSVFQLLELLYRLEYDVLSRSF